MNLTSQESNAIDSLRFLCIISLVFLHTRISHLVPDSVVNQVEEIQEIIHYSPFLCVLFLLSGFLFFIHKEEQTWDLTSIKPWIQKTYLSKLKKRVKSLVIPYFIFCTLGFLYGVFIKNKDYNIHSCIEVLNLFWSINNGHPVGMAMWFMRNLIVFSVLSPLYYIVIKILRHFTLILILILFTLNIDITYPYINVYLLLGAYLAMANISFSKLLSYFDWRACLLIWMIFYYGNIFYTMPKICGIVPFMLSLMGFIGLFMTYSIPSWLTKTSSFVYFTHPFFTGIRNIFIKYIDTTVVWMDIACWIAIATTVFIICEILFFTLKRISPKALETITGGRI